MINFKDATGNYNEEIEVKIMEYEIEKLENPDWIDNTEESFKKYRMENYGVYEINLDKDSIERLIQGKKCMVGTINSCEFGIIVSFNNRDDNKNRGDNKMNNIHNLTSRAELLMDPVMQDELIDELTRLAKSNLRFKYDKTIRDRVKDVFETDKDLIIFILYYLTK